MANTAAVLLLALPILVAVGGVKAKTRSNTILPDKDIYTPKWVVEIAPGEEERADAIAADNCFTNMGEFRVSLHL